MAKLNYFEECNTIDEAKNLFRKLCKELHPDVNPSKTAHKDFINMRDQYERFTPSTGRERNESDKADNLYNIVKQFEKLNGVLITFVGSFIWLEDQEQGATKSQKEIIKSIIIEGYNRPRFGRNRGKWFYSPEGYKQKFRSKKNFEQIKQTWGAKTYKPREQQRLQTA